MVNNESQGYRAVAALKEKGNRLPLKGRESWAWGGAGVEGQKQKARRSQYLNSMQSCSMFLCYERFKEKVCGLGLKFSFVHR